MKAPTYRDKNAAIIGTTTRKRNIQLTAPAANENGIRKMVQTISRQNSITILITATRDQSLFI